MFSKPAPKITFDLVHEHVPKPTKENKLDADFAEVMKDYNLCIKALIEQDRLERIVITLPTNKQRRAVKEIETITYILRQTKNRLRMNASIAEARLKHGVQDLARKQTLVEIKTFLKDGVHPALRQTKGRQDSQSVAESTEADRLNQHNRYPTSELLEIAQIRVSRHQNMMFKMLHGQIASAIEGQPYVLRSGEDAQHEDQFYRTLANQFKAEDERLARLEQAKAAETRGFILSKRLSMLGEKIDLAGAHIKLDMMEDADEYFREKAKQMRLAMKRATDQVFKKKFGNSLVKKKRERQEDHFQYQMKEQAEIKEKIIEKLGRNEAKQDHQKSSLSTRTISDIQFPGVRISLPELEMTYQPTPTSFINSGFNGGQIDSPSRFSLYSTHRPSKVISKIQSQNRLSSMQQNPPSHLECMKKVNSSILAVANKQYQSFAEEKDGIRSTIRTYRSNLITGIDKIQTKYESYKLDDI